MKLVQLVSLSVSFALVALVAACGGASKPASSTAAETATAAPSLGPLGVLCEEHYARERTCSSEYLAALVALRVEVDMPPGIAAEDARDGREATIAAAWVDWTRDSQPAERSKICRALDAQVPPERVDALKADAAACLSAADCTAFAACAVEHERSYIVSGDQHAY